MCPTIGVQYSAISEQDWGHGGLEKFLTIDFAHPVTARQRMLSQFRLRIERSEVEYHSTCVVHPSSTVVGI